MNKLLSNQVQQLGDLRARIKALEAQENELSTSIRSQMSEHGLEAVKSNDFEARLVRQERLSVDVAKFRRAVSPQVFAKCVAVSVPAARNALGDDQLRKIAEVQSSVQVRVTALRDSPARADSRQAAGQENL